MAQEDLDRSVLPAAALPRLEVLLAGGGSVEAPLRSLARGEYEILAVADAAAARRVMEGGGWGSLCRTGDPGGGGAGAGDGDRGRAGASSGAARAGGRS